MSYPKPLIKSSADLQLQNAFQDGHWSHAVRLAEKRAKLSKFKDSYYQAVAVAAKSQFDAPLDKCAALAAVDECLKRGASVKDSSILELYEWACQNLVDESQYGETHGQLRLRLVKAVPKDKANALQCLRLCLLHWDLTNAQQIAALMDRTFVSERQYHFWNILFIFLLSLSSECSQEKRKLYSLLALKLFERAAEMTEVGFPGPSLSDRPLQRADLKLLVQKDGGHERAIHTEEELLLYYRVISACGTVEEVFRQLRSPSLGALRSFNQGQKYLFHKALDTFRKAGDQASVFSLCKQVLGKKNGDGSLFMLGSDFSVWKQYIAAAAAQPDSERALWQVRELLETYVAQRDTLRPVYSRIISLALLDTAFHLHESPDHFQVPSKTRPRLAQIRLYLQQNYDKLACFDDLRPYVQQLSFDETRALFERVFPSLKSDQDSKRNLLLSTLSLKFEYLVLTTGQTLEAIAHDNTVGLRLVCKWCEVRVRDSCRSCLTKIVAECMNQQQVREQDNDLAASFEGEDVDPTEERTVVAAMALLRLSGLHNVKEQPASRLCSINMPSFLQAVALLDAQLCRTPEKAPIRLLLVQLYLLLGCASYAYQIWIPLNVKRTIQDSLSPLFFDRISSVCPGLFRAGPGLHRIVDPMKSYYLNCLRLRLPTVVWDALEAGSYNSVLEISDYMHKLRFSCTLVMALLEEKKGMRALHGKTEHDVANIPLLASISPKTQLSAATDYGSLPNLEGSHVTPLFETIQLGPALSNNRSHLDLLAERYLDLIHYSAPKDYKPAKLPQTSAKEGLYVIETLERLYECMTSFLHLPSTPSALTRPEESYFTIVSLSAALAHSVIVLRKQSTITEHILSIVEAIATALSIARDEFDSAAPQAASNFLFLAFGSCHATFHLLSSAKAVKQTLSFIHDHHEKQLAIEKTGKTSLPKTIPNFLKPLEEEIDASLKSVKERVGAMKSSLDESGWMDRLAAWAFGTAVEGLEDEAELEALGHGTSEAEKELSKKVYDAFGGLAESDTWGERILKSWRESINGWLMVRME